MLLQVATPAVVLADEAAWPGADADDRCRAGGGQARSRPRLAGLRDMSGDHVTPSAHERAVCEELDAEQLGYAPQSEEEALM